MLRFTETFETRVKFKVCDIIVPVRDNLTSHHSATARRAYDGLEERIGLVTTYIGYVQDEDRGKLENPKTLYSKF